MSEHLQVTYQLKDGSFQVLVNGSWYEFMTMEEIDNKKLEGFRVSWSKGVKPDDV